MEIPNEYSNINDIIERIGKEFLNEKNIVILVSFIPKESYIWLGNHLQNVIEKQLPFYMFGCKRFYLLPDTFTPMSNHHYQLTESLI